MKKSRILSNYRIEFRRKHASYQTEVSTLRWVRKFMDEFSIDHSSQIRHWQIDYFISELKKRECSYDELLQAKSALRFLMDKVLRRTEPVDVPSDEEIPGVFRVTG